MTMYVYVYGEISIQAIKNVILKLQISKKT